VRFFMIICGVLSFDDPLERCKMSTVVCQTQSDKMRCSWGLYFCGFRKESFWMKIFGLGMCKIER
jgi:hypothetical protein